MADALLSIRDLCVEFVGEKGGVRALDHVSIDLSKGEILGIAGESGSGKTTMAQAVMRILRPPAVITGGEVIFEGVDILSLSDAEMRELRWNRISMVFQSAMDSLNPVITIGEQITDTLLTHEKRTKSEARERAKDLLEMVGIERDRVDGYAHRFSGGMRQRVGIALALALKPSLIILDEPTTALDVIVERDILGQLRSLRKSQGFAVIFITHDLARMLQISDRVAVFYAARVAEIGPASELQRAPRHPYTQGLLRAFPSVRPGEIAPVSIPGSPPSLRNPPKGCRFHPRCHLAEGICRERAPALQQLGPGHSAACHLLEKTGGPG
jgi:peptide/nickel transport system ATP-binding protein